MASPKTAAQVESKSESKAANAAEKEKRENLSRAIGQIEKAFGVSMETLMRMQNSFDIARARAREGEIEVAGPELARSLTELGQIDEYQIYLHPVVLGSGKPFFAGPRPPLRLVANERIEGDVIRLTYAPAV